MQLKNESLFNFVATRRNNKWLLKKWLRSIISFSAYVTLYDLSGPYLIWNTFSIQILRENGNICSCLFTKVRKCWTNCFHALNVWYFFIWSISYESDLSHCVIISVEMRSKNKWRKCLDPWAPAERNPERWQDFGTIVYVDSNHCHIS